MVVIDLAPPRRKPRTLSARDLKRKSSDVLRIVDDARPKTRAECCDGPRPCLFVSCRFHLYLEVNEATGSLKLNFPDVEPQDLTESCALDIAERGGLTLEEIGRLLNVTRERARQLEMLGLTKLLSRV
jgi:hypothetical protein